MHKDPPLDIVGWWSTSPSSGPDASHLPVHRQILQNYNESAVFLAFHPSHIQERHGAKLPLTVYESVLEGENTADAGKDMQIDGEEPALNIRFRELPYSVETGEAEMIGVDTIAKGSGAATRTETTAQVSAAGSSRSAGDKKQTEGGLSSQAELSQEEEERMQSWTSLSYLFTSNISRSNCKPQYPSQRRPHPRIPHLAHQILRLQHLRNQRRQRRPHDPAAITHHPSQHQLTPIASLNPFTTRRKRFHLGSSLPKQRRLTRISARSNGRERQVHARAGPQIGDYSKCAPG